MSIGYLLEIEYHDGTEHRRIFTALDAKDVAKLKSACERARKQKQLR